MMWLLMLPCYFFVHTFHLAYRSFASIPLRLLLAVTLSLWICGDRSKDFRVWCTCQDYILVSGHEVVIGYLPCLVCNGPFVTFMGGGGELYHVGDNF